MLFAVLAHRIVFGVIAVIFSRLLTSLGKKEGNLYFQGCIINAKFLGCICYVTFLLLPRLTVNQLTLHLRRFCLLPKEENERHPMNQNILINHGL